MLTASASSLLAQPWVPPRNEGTVSLFYQNYYVVGHYNVEGHENTNGATHARAVVADLDFGLSDTIGLTISLPFIATKYTGPHEYLVGGIPTHPGPLDDRRYHGTWQDLRVEIRRMWWAGPVVVTPLAGVVIPTHDYTTHGEAVAGRNRKEALAGVSAGTDLDRLLPGVYAHGRYAIAVAERINGFASVRSNVDLEIGGDVSPRVAIRGLATWQLRHKGPTIPELAASNWLAHDRFMVARYMNVGGGMTVSIARNMELHGLWLSTLSGSHGAHRARMLTLGASWNFGSEGGFGAPFRDERSP